MKTLFVLVLLLSATAFASCEDDSYDMQKLVSGVRQGMPKADIAGYIDRAEDLDEARKKRIHDFLDELFNFPDIETAMSVWGERIKTCEGA